MPDGLEVRPSQAPTATSKYGELKLIMDDMEMAGDDNEREFHICRLTDLVRSAQGFLSKFPEIASEIQTNLNKAKKALNELFGKPDQEMITSNLNHSIASPSLIAVIINLERLVRGGKPTESCALSSCLLKRLANIWDSSSGVTWGPQVEQLIQVGMNTETQTSAPDPLSGLSGPWDVVTLWMSYLSDGSIENEEVFRLLLANPNVFFSRVMFRFCTSARSAKWTFTSFAPKDVVIESLRAFPLAKRDFVEKEAGRSIRGVWTLREPCSADELTKHCSLGHGLVVFFKHCDDDSDGARSGSQPRRGETRFTGGASDDFPRISSEPSTRGLSLPSAPAARQRLEAECGCMDLKSTLLAMCWAAVCLQGRIASNKKFNIEEGVRMLVLLWASFPPKTVLFRPTDTPNTSVSTPSWKFDRPAVALRVAQGCQPAVTARRLQVLSIIS